MPKKLLYIANVRMPTEKAHGVQIMEMCRAFAAAGLDVELLAPRRLNTITEDAFAFYGMKRTFRITYLPTLDLIRFGKYGFLLQVFSFTLVSAIVVLFRRSVDIVYSRDEYTATVLSRFCKNLVLEVHVKRSVPHFFRTARLCRGVIVISKGLADHVIENGVPKDKVFVAHDGVDLDEFSVQQSREEVRKELSLPLDKKIVGYVGKLTTMGEEKGVSSLLYAFVTARRTAEDLLFLLVGVNDDEKTETIRSFQEAGAVEGTYRIVGHVPHAEVPNYLRASDVLVMNYPNTAHYAHIMSPLKLFEYMASGTPIITTDLPSVREVLSAEEAFFVAPENPAALSAVLLDVMRDGDASAERARNAFRKVQGYSWTERAQKILLFVGGTDKE